MLVPSINDTGWERVISGNCTVQFEFLATKILVGRVVYKYSANPTPEMMRKCVEDLHSFFEKNIKDSRKAQADLQKIFE